TSVEELVMEASQVNKRSKQSHESSNSQEENRDPDSLSPLERLPSDLLHEIMNYIPQSVLELRLASRSLQSRVEEYVLHSVNIIDQLKFVDEAYCFVPNAMNPAEKVGGEENQETNAKELHIKIVP
ncbi:hypothetical protein PENTCL1PPCAC_29662, partial [Pristionchus entomophagus]